MYKHCIKRILDLILAISLAIILLPLFLIISIAIMLEDGLPVLYTPLRGGYNNKPFHIYKFRTMVKDADKIGGGTTALNDPRITKFGKFLRKTKLDEIPQLFNIILGEMSFVGPRPELIRYTEKYAGEEQLILSVRPGITDYSSIEFINLDEVVGAENADEVYEAKVLKQKNALRIKYAKEISFFTDAKIFCITFMKVVKKAVKYIASKGK